MTGRSERHTGLERAMLTLALLLAALAATPWLLGVVRSLLNRLFVSLGG
jgi:hypothetical protein